MIKIKAVCVVTCLLLVCQLAMAQAPEITSIDARTNYATHTITIVGSGFSSNMGVSFGGVLANVLSSSATNIEVEIPVNVKFDNIEVTNYDNNKSVKSKNEFFTTFGGSDFDISDINDPIEFNGFVEQHDLCVCDLDEDGKRDIVTSKTKTETDLVVYQNTTATIGSISFNALDKDDIPNLNVFTPTRNITCGDLNGDGKPEILVVRNDETKSEIYVLQNNSTAGNITFLAKISLFLPGGDKAIRAIVRDLNFDGKPEVIVSNSENNLISIFVNQSVGGGTVSFDSSPVLIPVTGAVNSGGIEVQDLDRDGKPEIIVNPEGGNNVYVLKNNGGVGSISFADAIEIVTDETIRNIKTGYINNDDLLDIVVTHTAANSMSIIGNNSTLDNLDLEIIGNWGTDTEPWGIDMGDIDGDGDVDIVVSNNGLATLNIFINESTESTFQFASNIVKTVSDRTRNVAVADFDNDAKPDIAFTSASNASTGINFIMGVMRNSNCYNPQILAEATIYLCDQPLTLETVPGVGVTYNWYQDNVFVQGPLHGSNTANESFYVANVSGVYKVQAESDAGACVIWSQDITIQDESGNVPETPTAINDGPACPEADVQLDVTFSGAIDVSWTYEWTGPNGFTSTDQSPVVPGVSADSEGTYTVIVSSGNCVSSDASTMVDVLTLQEFTVTAGGDTEFCTGGSSSLSVTNRAGHAYQWLKDGSPISAETGTSYVANQAGSYSVIVTNNSTTCSLETNTIVLSIFTAPTAAFDAKTLACLNEEITFTNNSMVDNGATAIYSWDFGDGSSSSDANPVHSYNTLNTFTVQLTVDYDGVSCTDVTSQTIEIVAPQGLTITADVVALCPGDEAVLSVDDTSFSDIIWNTTETTASITVTDIGDYSITATDSNGCSVDAIVSIIEKPIPDIQIEASDTVIFAGEQVQLEATGADTYEWTPAESLSNASIATPIAFPDVTTTYTVVGMITDGCTAQDSVFIEVREKSDAPKIFNINNVDGELWSISSEGATACNLTIFDRNGSKVFEGVGELEEDRSGILATWDGTSDGSRLPGGTYFYVYGCDSDKPRTGSILLVDL